MTDISVSKRNGYTVIPNDLLEPGIISASAWGIYVFLSTQPEGWRCNVSDLMTWFTEGQDELNEALNELRAAGYLQEASDQ